MTARHTRKSVSAAKPVPPTGSFRPEIGALRALAVLAVVFNHLWPDQVRGGFAGVDVFFVISGFLITGHLYRDSATRSGARWLAGFWARRARRLLPASFTVLLSCVILVLVLAPVSYWPLVFRQILGSALYVVNWVLAADSVDYFASENSPSPVTHFWSLAVEEQFYLLWPLLLLAAVFLATRLNRSSKGAIVLVLLAVTVGSFAASVAMTSLSPTVAYFATVTRAWEFGIGGLLALMLPMGLPDRTWRPIISWLGWGVIITSILFLSSETPFPGWAALAPVLGTVLVIASRDSEHPWSPGPMVRFGPVQYIGAISYSLYLWHWPLIYFALLLDSGALGDRARLLVLGLALVLAALSKRFVEDPVREGRVLAQAPPSRTLWTTLVAMAVVVGVASTPLLVAEQRRSAALDSIRGTPAAFAVSAPSCIGAAAVAPGATCPPGRVLDPVDQLFLTDIDDIPVRWGSVCMQDADVDALLECQFGVPEDEADLTVALVGDSHAMHWSAAIEELAVANHWNVRMIVKSLCPVTTSDQIVWMNYPESAESCHRWSDQVIERVADDDSIDLVITSSFSRVFGEQSSDGEVLPPEALADSYAQAWQVWLDAGKAVAAIADVPLMAVGDVPNCIARVVAQEDPCTTPTSLALPPDPIGLAAQSVSDPRFTFVDLTDFFCDAELCHSVTGGTMMYADPNHLAYLFARSLAPYLGQQLEPVVETR